MPIDTVSDVFHEWGLGSQKPQTDWDAPQPPRLKYVRDGIIVIGICVNLKPFNEGKTTFSQL